MDAIAEPSTSPALRMDDRRFYAFLLVSHVALLLFALSPIAVDAVGGRVRAKPLERNNALRVAVGWGVCALVVYGASYPAHRRSRRTAALAGCGLLAVGLVAANHRLTTDYAVSEDEQWTHLQELRIVECEPSPVDARRVRDDLRGRGTATFDDFHRRVMEQYAGSAPTLRRQWASVGDDEPTVRTLYVMNLVAGLWSFGNREAVDKPGCVCANERDGWGQPPASLAPYLSSEIGCCTDYANVCKALLDREGIENRLTTITGHVFNEVRLGGRWRIVDATINVFVDVGWDELYDHPRGRDAVTVCLFPHPSLNDDAEHRSMAGHFRQMTLWRLAHRPARLRPTEHPALPAHFAR